MSGDLLRRAAERLECLDEAIPSGPWVSEEEGDDDFHVKRPNSRIAYALTDIRELGDLIATMRQVAAPLADWLRCEARAYEAARDFGIEPDILAIARAVLGGDDA